MAKQGLDYQLDLSHPRNYYLLKKLRFFIEFDN
jgi:hypothetical protein